MVIKNLIFIAMTTLGWFAWYLTAFPSPMSKNTTDDPKASAPALYAETDKYGHMTYF